MTRDLLKFLLFVLGVLSLVFAAMRYFFLDVYAISGLGMIPTLMPGEQVFAWRDAEITQGDIVICEHPSIPNLLIVGRAFAMPGDELEVERGQIRINGRRLDTDQLEETVYRNPVTGAEEPVSVVRELLMLDYDHLYMTPKNREIRIRTQTIPEGKVFLLGDNRVQSAEDSRSFGVVTLSTCRAQLIMRNGAVDGAPGPTHGRFDILD
jgi:signal peptidase I